MANDILALMDHLGHERVAMVGHDRGARVATRFAKDHRGYWYFPFLAVPSDRGGGDTAEIMGMTVEARGTPLPGA